MFKTLKNKFMAAVVGVSALTLPAIASADGSSIDAMFDAVDVTGISTNVQTILIAFIGIGLLFLGYRYVRRTMSRG